MAHEVSFMRITHVFIDLIAITLGIKNRKRRRKIAQALNVLRPGRYGLTGVKYIKNYARYHDSYLLTFKLGQHREFTVQLSVNPIDSANNFFRVQLNPSRAGPEGMKAVYSVLKRVLGRRYADKLYNSAPITCVHVTMDVYGLRRRYFAYLPKKTHSKIIVGKQGGVTQIIGNGRERLSLYDKRAEQRVRTKSDSGTAESQLRLEFQRRDLRSLLSTLRWSLKNPFLSLSLFRDTLLDDKYFDRGFCKNVRKYGLNRALYDLQDENARRRYLRRLNRYHKVSWLQPEKRWRSWPKATEIFDDWKAVPDGK